MWLLGSLTAFGLAIAPAPAEKRAADAWYQARTGSFVVLSEGSASDATDVAIQFEQIGSVLKAVWPWARLDLPRPITVLAVGGEKGMDALLPERRGASPPLAAVLFPLPDRAWVVMRTDQARMRERFAGRSNPYFIPFKYYVDIVLRRNFRTLPVWLEVGLGEFWGNTIVTGEEVQEGVFIPFHIEALRDRAPRPLPELIAVDCSSLSCMDVKAMTRLQAESWALVHYLILGGGPIRREQLDTYAALLRDARPEAEAVKAFGDLGVLRRELDRYVRDGTAYPSRRRALTTSTVRVEARPVAPAESLAVRALFQAERGQGEEARTLAETSLALDPGSAAAEEALALSAWQAGRRDEALERLEKAASLPGASDTTHHRRAQLLLASPQGSERLDKAKASLQKVIELNPGLAAAHAELAMVCVELGEPLEAAFELLKRAIELEPTVVDYRLQALVIAARAGEAEPAREQAERMLAGASRRDRERIQATILEIASVPRPPNPSSGAATGPAAATLQGEPRAWGVFVNPDGKPTLDERERTLEIRVPGGPYDLSPEIGLVNAPRLLKQVEGDFVAEVAVARAPQPGNRQVSASRAPYNGAGLLLWQDERNYLRLELAAYLVPMSTVRYALFEWRRDGRPVQGLAPANVRLDAKRTELRLERRGRVVVGSVRQGKGAWIQVGRYEIELPTTVHVGVAAINTSGAPLTAVFEDFSLTPAR